MHNLTQSLVECVFLFFVLSGIAALPLLKWYPNFFIYKIIETLLLLFFICLGMVRLLQNIPKIKILIQKTDKRTIYLSAVFFGLVIALLLNLGMYPLLTGDDMTVEIMRTTISTNSMYQYNPATGLALQVGMYPVDKLVILPLIYSVFADLTGVDAAVFLRFVVPVILLILHFMIICQWADLLLKRQDKKVCFLCIYGVLLLFGDYMFITPAFRLLHAAHQGETLVITLCIPYLICNLLRLCRETCKPIDLAGICLCIVSGVFLAPIPIGLMLQVWIVILFLIIWVIRRKKYGRSGGIN